MTDMFKVGMKKHVLNLNRMFISRFFIVWTLGLCFPFFSSAASNESVVLIGSSDIPVTSIRPIDVNHIFLGKKTEWVNGNPIKFVTLKDGDTHISFLKVYIKKRPSQFKAYWNRMLFTGKGIVPRSFNSEKALMEFISENTGYIGYISGNPVNDNIKVIPITDEE